MSCTMLRTSAVYLDPTATARRLYNAVHDLQRAATVGHVAESAVLGIATTVRLQAPIICELLLGTTLHPQPCHSLRLAVQQSLQLAADAVHTALAAVYEYVQVSCSNVCGCWWRWRAEAAVRSALACVTARMQDMKAHADSTMYRQSWSSTADRGEVGVGVAVAKRAAVRVREAEGLLSSLLLFDPDSVDVALVRAAAKAAGERGRAAGHRFRVISSENDLHKLEAIALAPDGRTVAVAGTCFGTNPLQLWDLTTGCRSRVLRLSGWAAAVAWSPDGYFLAAGLQDGVVELLEGSGHLLRTLYGHTGTVRALAWSPEGRYLATAAGDCKVRVWDIDGIKELPGRTSTSFMAVSPSASPSSTPREGCSAFALPPRSASSPAHAHQSGTPRSRPHTPYSSNGEVAMVHQSCMSSTPSAGVPGSPKLNVTIPPIRTMTAAAQEAGFVGTVAVTYSAAHVKCTCVLRDPLGPVVSMAWSPDGSHLATASRDPSSGRSVARLWDVASGLCLRSLLGAGCVAWSPDGSTLATAFTDGPSPTTSRPTAGRGGGGRESSGGVPGSMPPFASSTTHPCGSHRIKLWRVATRRVDALAGAQVEQEASGKGLGVPTKRAAVASELEWELHGHKGAVTALKWSPNGKALLSGSQDGTAVVWLMGSQAADVRVLRKKYDLKGHSSPVLAVAWNYDGSAVVTGSADGFARAYSAQYS